MSHWVIGFMLVTWLSTAALFVAAFATPPDDGSKSYPRETIAMCAIALSSLSFEFQRAATAADFLRLTLVMCVLQVIGARQFFRQRHLA